MSKISLKHSGGNVVSLNSPTNAPAQADVAFKLPNEDGSDGQALVTDGSGNLSFSRAATARNLIINGDMQVAQRDTSSTSSGYQTVDRFSIGFGEGAITQAQVDLTSSDTPYSSGFRKAYKLTNSTASTAAGAARDIRYKIEAQDLATSGWDSTSSSSNITLSFWVRSSVAQTYYVFYYVEDSSKHYAWSFALSANTWTKVTKTVSGASGVTITNDNGLGMQISIVAFYGTSFTDSSQGLDAWGTWNGSSRTPDMTNTWGGTTDATFEVTGVQLEVGSVATDFEHRSFGDELAKCQRYFYKVTKDGTDSEVTNMPIGTGVYYTANDFRCILDHPVEMRAAPTLTSNDNSGSYYIHFNSSHDGIDRLDSFHNSRKRSMVRNTAHASGTQGYPGLLHQENSNSSLTFSAEL